MTQLTRTSDLPTALENAATVKSLTFFIQPPLVPLLDQLNQLQQLETLYIRMGLEEVDFPPAIWELTQLKELSIESFPLEKLPRQLEQFQQLEKLSIRNSKLKELPEAILKLPSLKALHIEVSELTSLGENIGQLTTLQDLRIVRAPLQMLPASLSKCKELEILAIYQTGLREVPDVFQEMQNLRSITLSENQLTTLPLSLFSSRNLTFISLNNNRLTKLPKEIAKNPLEYLHFENNQIEELSPLFDQLQELFSYKLAGNPLQKMPLGLAQLILKRHNFIFSIDDRLTAGYNDLDFTKMLEHDFFKSLAAKNREDYFFILVNDRQRMANMDKNIFRQALNASLLPIALNSLLFLCQSEKQQVLGQQAELFLAGDTVQSESNLSKRLQPLGIQLTTQFSPQTTHVLINAGQNKKLDQVPQNWQGSWLSEYDLEKAIEQQSSPHSTEDITKLAALLQSSSKENLQLALQLIEGSGLPESLITDLFMIYKLGDHDEAMQLQLLEILRRKAPPQWLKLLNWEEEKGLLEQFRFEDFVDTSKFMYYLYMLGNRHFEGVLKHTTGERRKKAIHHFVHKSFNKSFQIISYNKVNYTFTTFPKEILDIPTLKAITFSAKNYIQKDGKEVRNTMFQLPQSLTQLKNLESLQIDKYVFETLPVELLSQLTSLKSLVLQITPEVDWSSLKTALPDCTFYIQETAVIW